MEVDDFVYWVNLAEDPERVSTVRMIEGAVNAFAGLLEMRGIPFVEVQLFTFDTRAVSVNFGGLSEEPARVFSITLEDLSIDKDLVSIPRLRVGSFVDRRAGRLSMTEFIHTRETSEGVVERHGELEKVKPQHLLGILVRVYNEHLAKKDKRLPPIDLTAD